jgi:hypothetical protein
LELLVVLVVLLVLAAIAFPTYQSLMSRFLKGKCVANLRSLHVSFGSCVNDEGRWPQFHYSGDMLAQDYESWWINKMRPYGATEETWLCPVLKGLKLKGPDGKLLRMHYVPTQFDANPLSPTRWPTQPWLVETANAHGTGALIIFTDGSVRSMDEVLGN